MTIISPVVVVVVVVIFTLFFEIIIDSWETEEIVTESSESQW